MLWLAIWIVWTVLALMSASQTAIFIALRGQPVPWEALILGRLADWYSCAIFTPLFFWLARRFPLERGAWKRNLLLFVPIGIVAVVIKYAIYVPISHVINRGLTFGPPNQTL